MHFHLLQLASVARRQASEFRDRQQAIGVTAFGLAKGDLAVGYLPNSNAHRSIFWTPTRNRPTAGSCPPRAGQPVAPSLN